MRIDDDEVARLREENAALKEALRQHELRLQTLIESLPFDFWMMNEAGRYIVQNEASRRHWGEARGAQAAGIGVHPAVVSQWQDNNRRAFAGETIRSEAEYEHAGEKRHYLKVIAPVIDDGRVQAIIGVNIDITDSKRLAAQVERNERLEALGVLAGGIAHDFNNHLMAVLGNVAVVKRQLQGRASEHALLAEVERACLAASGLTRQLLTFARGGEPVREPTVVGDLVAEMVRFTLRGRTSRPEVIVKPGLWAALVDAGQLQQVIQNLVFNAHEATPDGGVVRVVVENVEVVAGEHGLAAGRYVRIIVSDQGVGIRAEDLGHIFEPYFTTKEHGHGLGLAIVHSIARRHGGTIIARSRVGEGTSMSLYLPAADHVPSPPPRLELAKRRPRHVLVLDDDEALRDALSRMIEELGYVVNAVATTPEAVELYRAALLDGQRFDAVIVDLIVVGDPGGLECARRLFELDPDAKVIVASGYSHDAALAQPERHGFIGRLAKPFTFEELDTVLRHAFA